MEHPDTIGRMLRILKGIKDLDTPSVFLSFWLFTHKAMPKNKDLIINILNK